MGFKVIGLDEKVQGEYRLFREEKGVLEMFWVFLIIGKKLVKKIEKVQLDGRKI